jgi:hypothetical protein
VRLQFQKISRVIPPDPVVKGKGRKGEKRAGEGSGRQGRESGGQKEKTRGGRYGKSRSYPSIKFGACGGEGSGEAREGRRGKGG